MIEALLAGLERRLERGPAGRPDRLGGELLREPGGRQGGPAARRERATRARCAAQIAIANACAAYRLFEWSLGTPRWDRLAKAGARPQRPLWASTSTKDPRYPDVYYVEALVAPRTVNTLPPETFAAYRDHGQPGGADPRGHGGGAGAAQGAGRPRASTSPAMTRELEEEGVAKFAASYALAARRHRGQGGRRWLAGHAGCWRTLRRISLTRWIFIAWSSGILVGWLDTPGRPRFDASSSRSRPSSSG